MKYIISAYLACILGSTALAQDEIPDFGLVTLKDFSSTPFDSVYSSVVLFEKGRYDTDGSSQFIDLHIRVKINTKSAIDFWGNFELGNQIRKASRIKAVTHYIEGGKLVSHFVEQEDIYTDAKSNLKKISLPHVRPGCIIELSYRSLNDYILMPHWVFQRTVPVLWSEYQLFPPARLTYTIRGRHEPFLYDPKYKGAYSRWVFTNVPAFREEPLMPDPINFLGRIEFWQPLESWARVNNEFLNRHERLHENFPSRLLKNQVRALIDTISAADPLKKVKTLCRYVKENFAWSGDPGFLSNDFASILKEKKGSAGDLNTLLYAMLRFAGLDPDFVLLSTHDNGVITKSIPTEDQFNYLVCRLTVDSRIFFLDVTDPDLEFNIVPPYCLNTDALVISKSGYEWVKIEPEIAERLNVTAMLSFSENQTLKGSVSILKYGYQAFIERKKYRTSGEMKYKKESKPDDVWLIDSTQVANVVHAELPIVVTYFGSIPGRITENLNKFYVNPVIIFFASRNGLREEARELPIDLQLPTEKRLIVNLEIPEGFKIESLPENQTISLADNAATYSYRISSNDKRVIVIVNLKIEKTLFEREDYANLRKFFNLMILKQGEMIVLVKE